MKFDRKNIILSLSALLVLQIVIILFVSFFSTQKVKERKSDKKLIAGLSAKSIIALTVKDSKEAFSIEKKDEAWYVNVNNSFIPGDQEKIKKYCEILEELPVGIIRDKGDSIDNETYYGFDDKNYQEVVVTTDKNKKYKIIIGNTGSKRGTSYIRYEKEKKIREVQSFIASETSNEAIKWSYNGIFPGDIEIEDVDSCDINSSLDWFAGSYKIKFKEQNDDNVEDYELIPPVEGKELKSFVLQNSITNLIHLKADNYKLDGRPDAASKKAEIKVIMKNGTAMKAEIYKAADSEEGDYIVDVDFNDFLYYVDEGDVKRFVKSIDEMIVEEKAE